MKRDEWTWRSPVLDRDMSVCRWGHFGKPVLLFPTAGGDYLECERFLMIKVLAPLIDAGRIKVYSCASISADGWLDPDAKPAYKSWLQLRFDQYLAKELVPFIRHECGDTPQRLCATGASLGAYNAVNATARHPDLFDLCIAMSGTYDFGRWMGGYIDENYFLNMPLMFLPGLDEGPLLDKLRTTFFMLATGQGRAEAPLETVAIANLLKAKGVPHNLEIWGHDVHHDWPTWRTMLPIFLDKLV